MPIDTTHTTQAQTVEEEYDPLSGIDLTHPLAQVITPMLLAGDWDTARLYLQKIAYGMPDAKQEDKDDFTRFMVGFAKQDTLYQYSLVDIREVLREHPEGIRQTALYPHMTAALDVEKASVCALLR